MKWIQCLTSQMVASMAVEERGRLLTAIVCLMENIPFDPGILQGTAAYAFGLLEKAKQKEESKAAKCAEAGRKGGGNPALKATVPKVEKQSPQRPTGTPKQSGNKVSSKDVEEEISAFTADIRLQEALRGFVDYRKESGHPMTRHAFDLMLKKLEGLSGSDEERIEILNNSIVSGYQGIFKPNRNSGKTYGPNGVQIKPEPERLHDLDDIFGISG